MRSVKNLVLEVFRKAKIVIDILTLPEFASKSKNVRIELPRKISNPNRIELGNNVFIGSNSVIVANTGGNFGNHGFISYNPRIIIGDRFSATSHLEIYCCKEIVIESDVMLAANVFIYDHSHGYETANIPYKNQNLTKAAPVIIKKGCWIGQNVVILQGVTIGEYAIIGANSVVTSSIPARCIAVGSPAMPTKKWDEDLQAWVKFND